MALAYITLPEIQNFIGVSDNETLLNIMWETAESIFNNLIRSSGLTSGSKTDYFSVEDFAPGVAGRIFYLKNYNPTAVTTINGVSPGTVNVNYTLVGRRLEFALPVELPSTFPYRYTLVYTAGLSTITSDIKTACLYIVKGIWEQRKTMDIVSFSQDLLSVNYSADKFLDTITNESEKNFVRLIINKYTVPYFYAT